MTMRNNNWWTRVKTVDGRTSCGRWRSVRAGDDGHDEENKPCGTGERVILDDFNIGEAVCCWASERELMRLALMRKEWRCRINQKCLLSISHQVAKLRRLSELKLRLGGSGVVCARVSDVTERVQHKEGLQGSWRMGGALRRRWRRNWWGDTVWD